MTGSASSSAVFSIATWNINSVRLRLGLVLRYLQEYAPVILCLQETKCPDAFFPHEAFAAIGYTHRVVRGEKGYNGMAILSKIPLYAPYGENFCQKEECRHIAAWVESGGKRIAIHNFYVPAGGDIPDMETNAKFFHKISFLKEMQHYFAQQPAHPRLLVGDLNVAPLEEDVWSHKQLLHIVSHTPLETDLLKRVLRYGGWVDVVRQRFSPPQKVYTWWSYRAKDWALSDRGRRLDHIWASSDLAASLKGVTLLKAARAWASPSDHVPVKADFIF